MGHSQMRDTHVTERQETQMSLSDARDTCHSRFFQACHTSMPFGMSAYLRRRGMVDRREAQAVMQHLQRRERVAVGDHLGRRQHTLPLRRTAATHRTPSATPAAAAARPCGVTTVAGKRAGGGRDRVASARPGRRPGEGRVGRAALAGEALGRARNRTGGELRADGTAQDAAVAAGACRTCRTCQHAMQARFCIEAWHIRASLHRSMPYTRVFA